MDRSMAQDRIATRRKKLISQLKAQHLDALLVTSVTNVRYLTGFTGDSSWLLIGPKLCVLISDGRYRTQIEEECPGLEAVIRAVDEKMSARAAAELSSAKAMRVGFEQDVLTIGLYDTISSASKTLELVPTQGAVEQLRQVKDSEEIAEIRVAIGLAERAFTAHRATLRPDLTEREIAHGLEHTIRGLGGAGAAFPPIVAVGDRAALPHYRAGALRVGQSGLLLVDWGAVSAGGYHSDLTRVIVTSKLSPKLEQVYGVVLKAQLAAIAEMGPGVSSRKVDSAARSVIESAGFGKYFSHGLGHGIGLEIHEAPRMSPQGETTLQPGMVITVEPGIYLPGVGGVRIEDDVLITRDGAEVLTSVPKSWESCRVDFV
jgi:Xaa-Pro aminopeptidase